MLRSAPKCIFFQTPHLSDLSIRVVTFSISGNLLASESRAGNGLRGVNVRAIVLNGYGGFESLVAKELPDPKPKAGHVLIAVKAFGVNHAETHMRKGEWRQPR